jgi:hypothetical protein
VICDEELVREDGICFGGCGVGGQPVGDGGAFVSGGGGGGGGERKGGGGGAIGTCSRLLQ